MGGAPGDAGAGEGPRERSSPGAFFLTERGLTDDGPKPPMSSVSEREAVRRNADAGIVRPVGDARVSGAEIGGTGANGGRDGAGEEGAIGGRGSGVERGFGYSAGVPYTEP